jgi:hypothetical protein
MEIARRNGNGGEVAEKRKSVSRAINRGEVKSGGANMNQLLDFIAFPKTEAQEEASKLLIVAGINAVFLIVVAPVLWLLGHGALAWSFVKGYVLLWLLLLVLSPILNFIQRMLRLNIYDNANVFIASNLLVSGVLVLGWAAFAALAVQGAGAAGWIVGVLYVIGLLASYLAEQVVTAIFNGTIYQLANLVLALASFIVFAMWPASARLLFGWFFNLF